MVAQPDIPDIDTESITLADAKVAVVQFCNIVEGQAHVITELREKVQYLLDEIARLKGEQGRPDIRGKHHQEARDISSEKERRVSQAGNAKGSKNSALHITRTEIVKVDRTGLPEDVVFKGYAKTIVQNIVIVPDVVEFRREVYYSPSLQKSFTAPLPEGIRGVFGSQLKSFVILLKAMGNMSEPKINELLTSFGLDISSSSINRILLNSGESFEGEKENIVHAGLASTSHQHIDDTSARVNGENWYTQTLCNELYSAYFTGQHKDRLSILRILMTGKTDGSLIYRRTEKTNELYAQLRLSKKLRCQLDLVIPSDILLTEEQLCVLIGPLALRARHVTRAREALAISHYQSQTDFPVIDILIADDAPQFKLLTLCLALCWVHEGRHYKKLLPVVGRHQKILEKFLERFWEFYRQLLAYKQNPDRSLAVMLGSRFDDLFSPVTGYQTLDEQIAKTRGKKQELLVVLEHPDIPLHNNPAELSARASVRKRDVSLQTKSAEGTRTQDTFLTITETAKKLGVNTYAYILDRVSRSYTMPSLASIIRERSQLHKLIPSPTGLP